MSVVQGEPRLIAAFDEQAPPGLDRALAILVMRAYPAARDWCQRIAAAAEEDRDLRGHAKRIIIEGGLPSIPPRFPGVTERPVGNANDSSNHRELLFGDWIATVSHTQYPLAPLPDARFRDSLARPQAGFFPEFDIPQPMDGNFYAVLVHGSPSPFDLAPTHLNLVFPLPGGIHGYGINLFERYPDLRPKAKVRPVFGEAHPELRTDIELPSETDAGSDSA